MEALGILKMAEAAIPNAEQRDTFTWSEMLRAGQDRRLRHSERFDGLVRGRFRLMY